MAGLHSLTGVATSLLLVGGDVKALTDVMTDPRQGQGWGEEQQQRAHEHQHQLPQQPEQPQQGYYDQVPLLTGQWGAPSAQRPLPLQQPQQQPQQYYDLGNLDGRLYDNAATGYMPYSLPTTTANYPPDASWAVTGAMDIGDPQHYDTQLSPVETFPQGQQRLPHVFQDTGLAAVPPSPSRNRRPTPVNVHTAPTQQRPSRTWRPPLTSRSATAPILSLQKKHPTSSDSEEDFVPSSELGLDAAPNLDVPLTTATALGSTIPSTSAPTATRTRKRQRIPHTAVERRYRENLNAHLEKLRQAVPSLATSSLSALTLTGQTATQPAATPNPVTAEGAKPSKCEILNGAIEHIGAVERTNAGLRQECADLRRRVEEFEGWYGAGGGRAGGTGGSRGFGV